MTGYGAGLRTDLGRSDDSSRILKFCYHTRVSDELETQQSVIREPTFSFFSLQFTQANNVLFAERTRWATRPDRTLAGPVFDSILLISKATCHRRVNKRKEVEDAGWRGALVG